MAVPAFESKSKWYEAPWRQEN